MTASIVSSTHRLTQNATILSEGTEQQTPFCYRALVFFFLWRVWDGEWNDRLLTAWSGLNSRNTDFWLSHHVRKYRISPSEFRWFFFFDDRSNWAFAFCWPI